MVRSFAGVSPVFCFSQVQYFPIGQLIFATGVRNGYHQYMFDLLQNGSPILIARPCVLWLLGLVFCLIAPMAMAEVDNSPLVSRTNLQTPLDYSYDGDRVFSPHGAVSLDSRGCNVRHCCDTARALYQHRLCREHSTTSSNGGDSLTKSQTACLSTITMAPLAPQRHQQTKPPISPLFTIAGIALIACRSLVRHNYDARPNKHDRHQRTGATFGVLRFRSRCSDPGTGEFISRGPLECVNGISLYRGYFVPNGMDPFGQFTQEIYGWTFTGTYYREFRTVDTQTLRIRKTFPQATLVCRCGQMKELGFGLSFTVGAEIGFELFDGIVTAGFNASGTESITYNMQCDLSGMRGDRVIRTQPFAELVIEYRTTSSEFQYQAYRNNWFGPRIGWRRTLTWIDWYRTEKNIEVLDWRLEWDEEVISDTGSCCVDES